MNADTRQLLARLRVPAACAVVTGHEWRGGSGEQITIRSPIDGGELAKIVSATSADAQTVIDGAKSAFLDWRLVPAPRRGEFVRRIGDNLRAHKADLGRLVSVEVGKITAEAEGEVQEMIDICDFAVGLSRQLYGLTIASERPGHRLMEQWHPLGVVGVITAFNFPVAVWAWNAMLALVCGDSVVWKPSEKAPLSALACHAIAVSAMSEMPEIPPNVLNVVIGGREVGRALADSPDVPLVSATGSIPMGRDVAQHVAARLGRSLLELGGNNGMIVAPSADLELAVRSIVFAAAGTCGQRCTTLRRLIVHESVYDDLLARLKSIYEKLPVGNPLDEGGLVGPLIDEAAGVAMQSALDQARTDGGTVHFGERITTGVPEGGCYVRPALVEIDPRAAIVQQETFAPILYVSRYRSLAEAIELHNGVPQGLSSAILTSDVRESETFLGPAGSDCGIANVNIGTSGAEIGGAFGGEKETGGGRESGSDAWKNYMRRATNTVNYSAELSLSQGIRFEIVDDE